MSGTEVLRVFFTKYRNRLFCREKQRSLGCRPPNEPDEEQSILWVQYSGDSGLGNNGTLRLISKEEAIQRLREIYSFPSGVCKVVGLNSLVRQFGLRFHCNGIKQLAKDFLKACPACHRHTFLSTISPPPCPIPSAPTAHLNGYRLILLLWQLARSGHCMWSLFMTNNRVLRDGNTVTGLP